MVSYLVGVIIVDRLSYLLNYSGFCISGFVPVFSSLFSGVLWSRLQADVWMWKQGTLRPVPWLCMCGTTRFPLWERRLKLSDLISSTNSPLSYLKICVMLVLFPLNWRIRYIVFDEDVFPLDRAPVVVSNLMDTELNAGVQYMVNCSATGQPAPLHSEINLLKPGKIKIYVSVNLVPRLFVLSCQLLVIDTSGVKTARMDLGLSYVSSREMIKLNIKYVLLNVNGSLFDNSKIISISNHHD